MTDQQHAPFLISRSSKAKRTKEMTLKSTFLAAAMLLPVSAAFAQSAKPQPIRPQPKPAVVQAAKPQEVLEISQIVGIRQIDPATYEIDAKLQNGTPLNLRMNAFVMQDLGRQLGTYGHR
jgi:hypothetical protein